MKILFAVLALTAAALLSGGVVAGDKAKEVKLTGKICCAKCELGEGTACATVIVVTKDKKDTVYHFDAASHKKYHGDICTACKAGSVTGTVATADKKNTVTVKSLEYAK